MPDLKDLKELFTLLSFALGMFRSTPEGRARRAAIRAQKARLKYDRELRKEVKRGVLTWEQYREQMAAYDSAPSPLSMYERDIDEPGPMVSNLQAGGIVIVAGVIFYLVIDAYIF